jgi:putative ABC transport system ATP-binding protein
MNDILQHLFDRNSAPGHQTDSLETKNFIELQNIRKSYRFPGGGRADGDRVEALKSINLKIELDRITVIKGPSGSGKTTLLTVIGCMARPTSGRIQINGIDVSALPEPFLSEIRRRYFGFIFQNHNLIRGLSALENTMLPAYPTHRHPKEIRKTAGSLLSKLGVGGKAAVKVEKISGGERQRIAIARALINNPEILIADEPTAHLNTELAMKFLDIVARLHQEGKTILIATHDPLLFDSENVHRVVRLRDGKTVAQ